MAAEQNKQTEHNSQRRTTMTPEQRKARNAYMRSWRREHKDKIKASNKAYYTKTRAIIEAYRREHPEEF